MTKDFIHTRYYAPTITTVDDPLLKVVEVDNGTNWSIKFYVGNTLIDVINMEHLNDSKLNQDVLELPVYNEVDELLGTVAERISYSL